MINCSHVWIFPNHCRIQIEKRCFHDGLSSLHKDNLLLYFYITTLVNNTFKASRFRKKKLSSTTPTFLIIYKLTSTSTSITKSANTNFPVIFRKDVENPCSGEGSGFICGQLNLYIDRTSLTQTQRRG